MSINCRVNSCATDTKPNFELKSMGNNQPFVENCIIEQHHLKVATLTYAWELHAIILDHFRKLLFPYHGFYILTLIHHLFQLMHYVFDIFIHAFFLSSCSLLINFSSNFFFPNVTASILNSKPFSKLILLIYSGQSKGTVGTTAILCGNRSRSLEL